MVIRCLAKVRSIALDCLCICRAFGLTQSGSGGHLGISLRRWYMRISLSSSSSRDSRSPASSEVSASPLSSQNACMQPAASSALTSRAEHTALQRAGMLQPRDSIKGWS